MYPYESFLQESNQILQNLSDDFAYYLLYLDFTDFQMVTGLQAEVRLSGLLRFYLYFSTDTLFIYFSFDG